MQVAKNHFTDGLVMDLSPEITPNNCLTNALNATYVTMNGNELQLQNDMGNTKFGAYLPQGYVPLGTTQLGGIIYIISYNPTNGKTQIGSFPSPQNTFDASTALEEQGPELNYFQNKLQYKQVYNDYLLQPGDKFVFQFPTKESTLLPYLYDITLFKQELNNEELKACVNSFIKFDIGTVSQDGKLIYLTDLRNNYIVNKNIVEQDYNIYNSTISGNLALVLTKVFCNSPTLQVLATATDNDKQFKLQYIYTFLSSDKFIPSKVTHYINTKKTDIQYDDTGAIIIPETEPLIKWYRNSEHNMYKVSYSNIFNKVEFENGQLNLKVAAYRTIDGKDYSLASELSQYVDLNQLGTGNVQLVQYQYNIEASGVTVNFSSQAYLQIGESLKNIVVKIYQSDNVTPIFTSETFTTLDSYTFNIPYKDEFKANNLYIADFVYTIQSDASDIPREEHITRWLITEDGIFNDNMQDYHGEVYIPYWKKSVTTTLNLNDDTITGDYDNLIGLSQEILVKTTETHTFNNAKLITKIELDSNVAHLKCKEVKTIQSIQWGNGLKDTGTELNQELEYKDLTITNEQTVKFSFDYSIEGDRTTKVETGNKNILNTLRGFYPDLYAGCGYISDSVSIHSLQNHSLSNKLAQQKQAIAKIHIYKDALASESGRLVGPTGITYDALHGIISTFYTGPLDATLITLDQVEEGYRILYDEFEFLCNLYIYKTNQNLVYYTLNSSNYVANTVPSINISKTIDITDSPDFTIMLNEQTLQEAMKKFVFTIAKLPEPLSVSFIEDTSQTSTHYINMPSIPTDNVKEHLTLSPYNNLLIEKNAIKPLTQSYVVDKLYYYHDSIIESFDKEFTVGDTKYNGKEFRLSGEYIYARPGGTLTYMYTQDGIDREQAICNINTDAITKITTKKIQQ